MSKTIRAWVAWFTILYTCNCAACKTVLYYYATGYTSRVIYAAVGSLHMPDKNCGNLLWQKHVVNIDMQFYTSYIELCFIMK